MRNLLLTIQYDGTRYAGWQVQKNAVSVQEVLQNAMEHILQTRNDVVGSSRTDSGVHANMYCLNFHTDNAIPCENLVRALNTKLPYDIIAKECREVPEEFHARYDAVKKEYVYRILNEKTMNPFEHKRALFYPYRFDVNVVNETAQAFLGTHDFTSFQTLGGKKINTVRTVDTSIVEKNENIITFTVSADGFLYNMVRIMVGTLLLSAQGKTDYKKIIQTIEHKDRLLAAPTAPAHGLYLNKIYYNCNL